VFVDNILFFNENLTSTNAISKNVLRVFPNPASDKISIESSKEILQIECYNQYGQKINLGENNGLMFDLSTQELAPGIYFLEVTFAGVEQGMIEKIIVQ
jgi:hypothetical protein